MRASTFDRPTRLRLHGGRGALVAAVVSLAWVLTGCPAPPPRYPIRESSRVFAVLRAHAERVRSFHASGSADQFGPQGRVRGTVEIYTRAPDRLRVNRERVEDAITF